MIICEVLLITVLIAMMAVSSVSDCKRSIIPNRLLFPVSIFAIAVDLVYYIVFVTDCFVPFITNLFFLTLVSAFFYGYNLWAAGDSKMLIVIGLCLPGRFYDFWDVGLCSSFAIIVLVFSIAFIYVIAESVVIGVKNRNLFQLSFGTINWKQWAVSYFTMVAAIMLLNFILSFAVGNLFAGNIFLSTAVSFLVVLTVIQIRERISDRAMYIWAAVSWALLIILSILGIYPLRFSTDVKSLILVLFIMLLRMMAEKYNYQVVPTSTVRAGQILSAATILSFAPSRVHGLPNGTTEDLRSRLTADEAASVRRWESSALGKHYVTIVRKIPFAIFISIGTVIFLGVEVTMLWYNR